MNKNYVNIKSLDEVKKEYTSLKRRIKQSERLVKKDYETFKESFTFPRLIMSAVRRVSKLSVLADGLRTGLTLLLALKKK